MARSGPLLTEAQWKKIAPLLPKPPKQRKGGRPWIENRRVLEGILWILRSGARWQDLPEKFPHPSTCWRRPRPQHLEHAARELGTLSGAELDATDTVRGSSTDRIILPYPKKSPKRPVPPKEIGFRTRAIKGCRLASSLEAMPPQSNTS